MAKCLNCLYINKVSKTPVNYLSSIVKFFSNEKILVCRCHLMHAASCMSERLAVVGPWILQRAGVLISGPAESHTHHPKLCLGDSSEVVNASETPPLRLTTGNPQTATFQSRN